MVGIKVTLSNGETSPWYRGTNNSVKSSHVEVKQDIDPHKIVFNIDVVWTSKIEILGKNG